MDTAEPLRLGGPRAASQGRAYAAAQLAGAAPGVVDDAQLVLTELVTNAQLHGDPPVVLRVVRVGDGARVEVQDASPRPLVRPVQSSEAMTGRGLALVAALAASWGVDPLPGGGKRVWAELVPGASTGPEPPLFDVDRFLEAWSEDEPPEPEHTVRLGEVPTGLLLEAKRHIDNVVRELTFERAAAAGPLPPEVETLVDTVTRDFSRARTGVKEQAAAASARGDRSTSLVLTLPASSIEAGERYLAALDEADRYARRARLLTLETPPLHRLFRHWYVTALVEQLRARVRGEEPAEPTPFTEVLAEEVAALSGLRDAAHRLDLLQQVNAALTDAGSAEAMARVVVTVAARELGAVTARVYLAADGVLRSVGQAGAPAAGAHGYDTVPVDADLPAGEVHRTGRPLAVRDLGQLVARFPALAGLYSSERSLHVVPLQVGRHRLGVLALGFPPSSRYDESAQSRYVRALADALAQGLERIDVAERLAALGGSRAGADTALSEAARVRVAGTGAQRLKSLADAAAAMAGARSVGALLEVVSDAARAVVGTHQAVATRLYGGTWQYAETRVSLSDDYADWRGYDRVPEGRGVLNVVTRENRPLRLTAAQLQAHPEFRGLRDAPGHPPLPDYLAAPLVSRDGRNIGLVQLSHKQDGSDFDEADEAVAVQLALMVSAALEHVESAAELERALRRLRAEQDLVGALHEVGRAVTSRLETADVVRVVTEAATTMTGADFGAFFSAPPAGSAQPRLDAVSGVPRARLEGALPRDPALLAPTFAGEGVARRDDVRGDPRFGPLADRADLPVVRSCMTLPVTLADGEVVGALLLAAGEPGAFDDDAEQLAAGIVGYASIALENGRLYDAARRETAVKEQVAAALEQPLQPPELPAVPGVALAAVFAPLGDGGRLGGDFYDVFPLDGGRWMLALGDVAGKGPEAAAVTGLVRHTLWGAAQYAPDPVAVARAVNGALLRGATDRFATLVLAVLTPGADGVLVDAVWAGHPPAVLLRDGGATLLSGEGMPVGMFADPELEPVRFRLLPGETLLLCTDGLLERADRVLEEAELVALLQEVAHLPVDEALPALAARVAAAHPARDDVAAVALRVLLA